MDKVSSIHALLSDNFYIGDKDVLFSAVQFSDKVSNLFCFRKFRSAKGIKKALSLASYAKGGSKNLLKALQYVESDSFNRKCGARPQVPKVVIIITGNKPNNAPATSNFVNQLTANGVTVISVGIGPGITLPQVQELASSNDLAFFVDGGDNLEDVEPDVSVCTAGISTLPGYSMVCSERCAFNLECTETNGEFHCVCHKGYFFNPMRSRCEELPGYDERCNGACSSNLICKGRSNSKKCVCRDGFHYDAAAEICALENVCESKVDLLFIIDGSGSLGPQNFQNELNFVADLSNSFKIGDARISALRFSTDVDAQFDFNKYSNNAQVLEAIRAIKYTGGITMTADALEYARETSFSAAAGAREDVNRVAIVITDGNSTLPESTITEARELQASGVEVLAVGIGSQLSPKELNAIASSPERVFMVNSFDVLSAIKEKVLTSTCDAAQVVPGYNQFCREECSSNFECMLLDEATKCGCPEFNYYDEDQDKCMPVPTYKESCTTQCRANLICTLQEDESSICLCAEGQYFDEDDSACAVLPGFQEECDGQCSSNYECRESQGNLLCLCPKGFNYDSDRDVCDDIPDFKESCTDSCASNLVCRKFWGTMQCRCAVSFYWNPSLQICEYLPRYDEPCSGRCSWPFWCRNVPEGGSFCLCKNTEYYDPSTYRCKPIPTYNQPCLGVCQSNLKCTQGKCQCSEGFNFDTVSNECSLVSKCNSAVDLVFAIDASGSLGLNNFKKELAFVKEIIGYFPVGPDAAQISALTFASEVNNLFCLDQYSSNEAIARAIENTHYSHGVTMTGDAIRYIRSETFSAACGARKGASKVVIVLTDGRSTESDETVRQALILKSLGVEIISIGIGNQVDSNELKAIASNPDLVFYAPTFEDLASLKAQVVGQSCEAAGEAPGFGKECTDDCASNYVCKEEKEQKRCRCAAGFYYDQNILACIKVPSYKEKCGGLCASNLACQAHTCQCSGELQWDSEKKACVLRAPCRVPLDLLFVIDCSGSLGEINFKKELAFVQKLLGSFSIGPQNTRVAALTFSTQVNHRFCFNKYNTSQEVINDIINTPYPKGVTMTHQALKAARTEYYNSKCGARDNAAQVTVVITDGQSTFPSATQAEAPLLHGAGVKVVSVGVGAGISQDELKVIASSDDLVFSATNFDVLDAIEKEVSATACKAAEDVPGYLEGCTDQCASNLHCLKDGTENLCECLEYQYFDQNTKTCVALTCLSGLDVCSDKPNGDYPACAPMCGYGYFYNCYNGHTEIGQCVNGQLEIALHPGQTSSQIVGKTGSERCSSLVPYCPQN
ncbi:matrilin-2 [Aplysia californica]|uniref:Matrilin-2 n=1 Tax=Aplysia californica TaxID=6500 RepID=A0ABM1VWU4_APLCA|nr:matrilin-2 [Aplysia californica]